MAAVTEAAKNSEGVTSLHYRVTGTVPDMGRLSAEACMTTKPLAMRMKMTMADQPGHPLEVRFVGKTMYVGGKGVDPAKLDGKSWWGVAPAAWGGDALETQSYGVLPRQMEGSPAVQSTVLAGSPNVRTVGEETVDGTGTTHYTGTVTTKGLSDARAAADGATRERLIKTLMYVTGLRIDRTLTMDLWVDGDDRAKQFRVRGQAFSLQGANAPGPLDLTVTFLDVNQPVTVEAPPTEDTRMGLPSAD
ncbi:LppX_LprAFG lipoprotein [Streptomyces sp. ALI-76-A]|uniref:LppX_LprAFG lipoprotein n=1 Tax=Streptomyces sp. ALI-76-A TaxID=3025736 RepID=UPI00256EBB72|nr:LppX_LprAFG lipoprotein [Streptomyces sp. ALI-76-A]MDL5199215.1 LppX_LprAFG lipoprotein [Streptomyces sp. ALI-76-A]